MFERPDEFTIAKRKKDFGVGPDDFHWDGIPLGDDELGLLAKILEKAVERKRNMDALNEGILKKTHLKLVKK